MPLACFPLNRWKIATFFCVSEAITVELATLLLNDILRKSSLYSLMIFQDLTVRNYPNPAACLCYKYNYFQFSINIECRVLFSFLLNISIILT